MSIRKARTTGKAPCPRYGHGAAFLDGAVYVYGGNAGVEGDFKIFGDLHSLRVPTGLNKDEPYVWSQVIFSGPNTPEPRYRMTLNTVQQKLLLIGGCGTNTKCLSDFWLIEPPRKGSSSNKALAVQLKPEGTESFAGRYSHTTAVVQDHRSGTASVLIAGGNTDYCSSNEVFKLELERPAWWLLHFLEATRMIPCLGKNDCRASYELYVGHEVV